MTFICMYTDTHIYVTLVMFTCYHPSLSPHGINLALTIFCIIVLEEIWLGIVSWIVQHLNNMLLTAKIWSGSGKEEEEREIRGKGEGNDDKRTERRKVEEEGNRGKEQTYRLLAWIWEAIPTLTLPRQNIPTLLKRKHEYLP